MEDGHILVCFLPFAAAFSSFPGKCGLTELCGRELKNDIRHIQQEREQHGADSETSMWAEACVFLLCGCRFLEKRRKNYEKNVANPQKYDTMMVCAMADREHKL